MLEFWQHITLPYHLLLTVGLILMLGYWFLCLIGVGIDTIDLDFDLDADADTGDASSPLGLGLITGFVKFINGNTVPLSTIGSFLILLTWIGALNGNYYFNPENDVVKGWMIVVLAGIVSIPATKIVTWPLVPFFRKLRDSEKVEPILNQRGIVITKQVDDKFGQVEVIREGGAPATINCITTDNPISRGSEVLIESYDEFTGLYTVYPIKHHTKTQ